MNLVDLLSALPALRLVGDGAVAIRSVTDDSRQVGAGDLFVAVRGLRVDGHRFAAQAVAQGAAALVVERELPDVAVPQVVVPNGAIALGHLVARLHGDPARRLQLVGVTGTNGKTTTTYLAESILAAAGLAPGVIGTVTYRYGGTSIEAPYTTPTPAVLHQTFADMLGAGCKAAVLEVSSAALDMERMAGVRFQVACFTNLTQDHLDLHGTMEAYGAAKERLFRDHLADGGVAAINIDDPHGEAMATAAAGHRVLRVSAEGRAGADVRVARSTSTVAGIEAEIETPRGLVRVASPVLIGGYNVANLAMAVAIGEALGLDHAAIAAGIAALPGVPGRVEKVANAAGLDIFVDYAHTPDALTNVLSALKPLTKGRLICVFGCGGDRDPGKRPRMGAAVAALADLAVVTSDNPRTEAPQAILDMILPAVPEPFFVDVDRRTAIQAAIAEAAPGDVVVIAGKGHEDYQILGTTKVHFDDREEAAAAVAMRHSLDAAIVASVTGGALRPGSAATAGHFARVVIDGRQTAPGDLYVAIRGERFDGHDFCAQAILGGAAGLLVERGRIDASEVPDTTVIEVDDTRVALGAIARHLRRTWAEHGGHNRGRRLVGVTGSTGKTTTKELIRAALSAAGRVHASSASLNNETGVPLTLLGLRPFHDFAVVEMGMRGRGQIDYLADIAEPDVGVVVNAGTAHIELLGSTDAIAEAKAEIFTRLGARPDGTAVYPAGDLRLARHAAAAPRHLTFGEDPGDVRLISYKLVRHTDSGAESGSGAPDASDIVLRVDGRDHALRLPLVGRHNAWNAACAVAVALAVGVPVETALAGLAHARPPKMRSETALIAGRHVLVDCYNANPASMAAALATLAELRDAAPASGAHPTPRRAIAVLGDMLELGPVAESAHRDAGRLAASRGLEVIALGAHKETVAAAAREAGGEAWVTDDPQAAARRVLERTGAGDWVLVKASRGMRLERVVTALREDAK